MAKNMTTEQAKHELAEMNRQVTRLGQNLLNAMETICNPSSEGYQKLKPDEGDIHILRECVKEFRKQGELGAFLFTTAVAAVDRLHSRGLALPDEIEAQVKAGQAFKGGQRKSQDTQAARARFRRVNAVELWEQYKRELPAKDPHRRPTHNHALERWINPQLKLRCEREGIPHMDISLSTLRSYLSAKK